MVTEPRARPSISFETSGSWTKKNRTAQATTRPKSSESRQKIVQTRPTTQRTKRETSPRFGGGRRVRRGCCGAGFAARARAFAP